MRRARAVGLERLRPAQAPLCDRLRRHARGQLPARLRPDRARAEGVPAGQLRRDPHTNGPQGRGEDGAQGRLGLPRGVRPRRAVDQHLRDRRLPGNRLRAQGRPRGRDQARQAHGRAAAGADPADPVSLQRGSVADELASEFPGLALHWTAIERGSGKTPAQVRERLKEMSNRISGQKAIQMRQETVPWAYRVFFRQVGIDPDERRTPVEQIVLDRLKHGGFRARNLLDDAITIATFETGVPLIAFDSDRVEQPLHLRLARTDELMGASGRPLSAGQIVIADQRRPLAVLFADLDPEAGVTHRTGRITIVAGQVEGVPDIPIEEALWTVEEIVTGE